MKVLLLVGLIVIRKELRESSVLFADSYVGDIGLVIRDGGWSFAGLG